MRSANVRINAEEYNNWFWNQDLRSRAQVAYTFNTLVSRWVSWDVLSFISLTLQWSNCECILDTVTIGCFLIFLLQEIWLDECFCWLLLQGIWLDECFCHNEFDWMNASFLWKTYLKAAWMPFNALVLSYFTCYKRVL